MSSAFFEAFRTLFTSFANVGAALVLAFGFGVAFFDEVLMNNGASSSSSSQAAARSSTGRNSKIFVLKGILAVSRAYVLFLCLGVWNGGVGRGFGA